MRPKLFGMTVGATSRRTIMSYWSTTRRLLETHSISWWPLHLDRDCFLVLLRNHRHLHIILNCDDSRDWAPTSLLDLAGQSLRDWRSKHQESLFRSVSGRGHLLTLTVAALRYSPTPQTPEDQTTGTRRYRRPSTSKGRAKP